MAADKDKKGRINKPRLRKTSKAQQAKNAARLGAGAASDTAGKAKAGLGKAAQKAGNTPIGKIAKTGLRGGRLLTHPVTLGVGAGVYGMQQLEQTAARDAQNKLARTQLRNADFGPLASPMETPTAFVGGQRRNELPEPIQAAQNFLFGPEQTIVDDITNYNQEIAGNLSSAVDQRFAGEPNRLRALAAGQKMRDSLAVQPAYDTPTSARGVFAEAASALDEQEAQDVLRLVSNQANPDLSQQVGLRSAEQMAPLVQYDEAGNPVSEINRDFVGASTGRGGATGAIYRGVRPDGSTYFTDLPEEGTELYAAFDEQGNLAQTDARTQQRGLADGEANLNMLRNRQVNPLRTFAEDARNVMQQNIERNDAALQNLIQSGNLQTDPVDALDAQFNYANNASQQFETEARLAGNELQAGIESNLFDNQPEITPQMVINEQDPARREALRFSYEQQQRALADEEIRQRQMFAIDDIDSNGFLRRQARGDSNAAKSLAQLEEQRKQQIVDEVYAARGLDKTPQSFQIGRQGAASIGDQVRMLEFGENQRERNRNNVSNLAQFIAPEASNELVTLASRYGLVDANFSDAETTAALANVAVLNGLGKALGEPGLIEAVASRGDDIRDIFRQLERDKVITVREPELLKSLTNWTTEDWNPLSKFAPAFFKDPAATTVLEINSTGDSITMENLMELGGVSPAALESSGIYNLRGQRG